MHVSVFSVSPFRTVLGLSLIFVQALQFYPGTWLLCLNASVMLCNNFHLRACSSVPHMNSTPGECNKGRPPLLPFLLSFFSVNHYFLGVSHLKLTWSKVDVEVPRSFPEHNRHSEPVNHRLFILRPAVKRKKKGGGENSPIHWWIQRDVCSKNGPGLTASSTKTNKEHSFEEVANRRCLWWCW